MTNEHKSDCATHNMPAYPNEPCDCGVVIKPVAKLLDEDGNIFNLVGIASHALKMAGQRKEAEEMQGKIFKSGSYDEALQIIMQYCEVK